MTDHGGSKPGLSQNDAGKSMRVNSQWPVARWTLRLSSDRTPGRRSMTSASLTLACVFLACAASSEAAQRLDASALFVTRRALRQASPSYGQTHEAAPDPDGVPVGAMRLTADPPCPSRRATPAGTVQDSTCPVTVVQMGWAWTAFTDSTSGSTRRASALGAPRALERMYLCDSAGPAPGADLHLQHAGRWDLPCRYTDLGFSLSWGYSAACDCSQYRNPSCRYKPCRAARYSPPPAKPVPAAAQAAAMQPAAPPLTATSSVKAAPLACPTCCPAGAVCAGNATSGVAQANVSAAAPGPAPGLAGAKSDSGAMLPQIKPPAQYSHHTACGTGCKVLNRNYPDGLVTPPSCGSARATFFVRQISSKLRYWFRTANTSLLASTTLWAGVLIAAAF